MSSTPCSGWCLWSWWIAIIWASVVSRTVDLWVQMRVAFFNFSYLFIIYISMTNVLMNIIWLVPFYACGYSRNSASTVACWISMRTNHFYSWVDDLPLFIHLRIITKWKGYGVTLKDDFFWLSNLSLNMRGLVACLALVQSAWWIEVRLSV